MGGYYTLCYNTYAFSLLFYKVYMKRENAGSWNSGLEKEQILETYSAQLQKPWNSTKVIFGNNKKILSEENTRGGPHPGHEGGGAPYPPGGPPVAILCYMESFDGKKNHKPSSRTKLRRHEAEPI